MTTPFPKLFALTCCLLGFVLFLACQTKPKCQTADDCLDGQRCNTSNGQCIAGCATNDDCLDGEHCHSVTGQCVTKVAPPCPNGKQRTNGTCPCQGPKDCRDTEQCNEQSKCQPLCLPGSQGPEKDGCTCPSGWEWVKKQCKQKCPKDFIRGPDGFCSLNHLELYPKLWEKNAKGEPVPKCTTGVQRDTNGFCARKTPTAKPGPQKACPSSSSDKWDEDYPSRNKLPSSTPLFYVDSSATTPGDGSKAKPFQNLNEATSAARSVKGAVVLLAPGTYQWGVSISSSLHLVGRCTEGVNIQATSSSRGPAITSSGQAVTIEGLHINGASYAPGPGIQSLSNKGPLVVKHVKIQRVGSAGIYAVGGSASVEHCEISESKLRFLAVDGKQEQVGDGVRLDFPTGDVYLRYNRFYKHPTWGAYLQRAVRGHIEGNVFAENGVTSPYNKGGLYLYDRIKRGSKHPRNNNVVVRSNEFFRNIGYAMFAAYYQNLAFEDNLVHKNGFIGVENKIVRLLYIDSISFVRNHFLENTTYPSRMYFFQDAKILDNVYKDNAKHARYIDNDEPFYSLSVESKDEGRCTLRGNVFVANHDGINTKVRTLVSEGNLYQNNLYLGHTFSDTDIVLRASQFINNGLYGLIIWGKTIEFERKHIIQHNVFHHNGHKALQRERAAFRLSNGNVDMDLKGNLFSDNFIGTVIGKKLQEGTKLFFSGNVWHKQKHVGLMYLSGKGRLTLDGDLFEHNYGIHLMVHNNSDPPVIKHCGFANAKPGEAFSLQSIPKSAGVGIHIGAQGLVRWVFAKADYPCSPTQKGQVPKLADGWTMRPIRIPLAYDPCQSWKYRYDYPSEQARLKAGACQRCRDKGMGCRLIWEDIGLGKSKGTGLWQPANPSLECVPSDQYDSCVNPYTKTSVPLQTSSFAQRVGGQCLPLAPKDDPCARPEFKLCHEQARLKKKFCARIKNNFSEEIPVQGECRNWGANEFAILCRPDHKAPYSCKAGEQCFAETVTLKPLDMVPGAVQLEHNVFWNNSGPDVLMDLAGHVSLQNNRYLFCDSSQPNCLPKRGYRRTIQKDGDAKFKQGWEPVTFPKGATIVWQNPSPYEAPLDSQLSGNDLQQTLHQLPLLFRPDLCQTVSTQ